MTAARLLASVSLCAALTGCSGFTHFHSPRALPARGGTATVNVLVPVDFSLRVGLGHGWDAGLRFTRPGIGFTEVHADVQRDLRPGGDGRTTALGAGVGLSTAFNEWVLHERGGTSVVLQPYVAHGDDRAYAALRPTLVVSPDDGRTGWLSLATLGTARGDRTRLVPEVSLVGRIPTVGLGLQYRDERL